jgi:TP901 family phage tail tape measure protein
MNIGTLIATIGGDTSSLKRALSEASNSLNKFSKEVGGASDKAESKWKKMGSSFSGIGKTMSMAITLPLIAAGGVAAKLAIDWEQGMAKINTTAQLPKEGLKALSDQIKKLALDAGVDLSTVPEAYEKIISQTGDAALSTEIFTAALKGAKAGFTDISVVSGALAQSLSAIGAGKATAQEVTDVLFAAKRVGAGEFTDFANYVPSLIASAKGVGVSWKETAGAFAYMTGKGNDAASSTMLLQNAFNALGKSEITGGLKQAGISVFDTAGKMRGLSDIFTEVGNKMNGMNDEAKSKWLESIGLKDQQAKQAFMVLSSETDKLKIAMDATANASGELNSALNLAKNPAQDFSEAMSKLKGAGIGFGELLLPAITSVINSISSLLGWVGDLTETQKKWVIGIGAVVAAIGPLLFGLGFIISNIIPKLITGWGTMVKVFGAVKNAMVLLNAAAVANPWMALAVALVAVGTAIYYFSNKAKELSAAQQVTNDVNKEAKKAIVDQKIATEELLKVAADETKGLGQRQEAIRKLNEISPEYFGNLTVETANSKEAQTACENYTKALENQALVKAAQDKIDKLRADNANAEIEGTKRKVTGWKKLGIQLTSFTDAQAARKFNAAGIEQETKANKDYEESIKALEKIKADAMAGLSSDPTQVALAKKATEQAIKDEKKLQDEKKKNQETSIGFIQKIEEALKKQQELSGTFLSVEAEAKNELVIEGLMKKLEAAKVSVANRMKEVSFLQATGLDTSVRKDESLMTSKNVTAKTTTKNVNEFSLGKTNVDSHKTLSDSLKEVDIQFGFAKNSAELFGQPFDANATRGSTETKN